MKVAYRGKEAATEVVRGPSRAQAAETVMIRELVRNSPDDVSAWGRLMVGVELERDGEGRVLTVPILMSPERLAANNAAMEVDHKIASGQQYLANAGDQIPREWVERLVELHEESLDRLAELDVIRQAEAERAGRECPGLCAYALSRACREAEIYLRIEPAMEPGPPVQLALKMVGLALDADDVEAARAACKRYVGQVIWQRFEARIVNGDEG